MSNLVSHRLPGQLLLAEYCKPNASNHHRCGRPILLEQPQHRNNNSRRDDKSYWPIDIRKSKTMGTTVGGQTHESSRRSSGPLSKMRFYLDLKDYFGLPSLTTEIKELGGTIETFLSKDSGISCVITNRPKASYQLMQKNGSSSLESFPHTPSSNSVKSGTYLADSPFDRDSPGFRSSGSCKAVKTRTEALLEQALKSTVKGSCDVLQHCIKWNLKIMHIQSFLNWLKKVRAQMPAKSSSRHDKAKRTQSRSASINHKTKFVRHFLKFEDQERKFRPQYRQLSSWPMLNMSVVGRGSPFSVIAVTNPGRAKSSVAVTPALPVPSAGPKHGSDLRSKAPRVPDILGSNMVNKLAAAKDGNETSAAKTSVKRPEFQSKPGFCEMCSVRYEEMYKHTQTSKHKNIIRQVNHFEDLDKQMRQCPSLDEFVNSLAVAVMKMDGESKENSENSAVASQTRVDLTQRLDSGTKSGSTSSRPGDITTAKRRLREDLDRQSPNCSASSPSKRHQRAPATVESEPTVRNNKRTHDSSTAENESDRNIANSRDSGNQTRASRTTSKLEKGTTSSMTSTLQRAEPVPPTKRRRPLQMCDNIMTEARVDPMVAERSGAENAAPLLETSTRGSTVASSPARACRVLRSTARRRSPSSTATGQTVMSSPNAQLPAQSYRRQTRSSPGCAAARKETVARRPLAVAAAPTPENCRTSARNRNSRLPVATKPILRKRLAIKVAEFGDDVEQCIEDSGMQSGDHLHQVGEVVFPMPPSVESHGGSEGRHKVVEQLNQTLGMKTGQGDVDFGPNVDGFSEVRDGFSRHVDKHNLLTESTLHKPIVQPTEPDTLPDDPIIQEVQTGQAVVDNGDLISGQISDDVDDDSSHPLDPIIQEVQSGQAVVDNGDLISGQISDDVDDDSSHPLDLSFKRSPDLPHSDPSPPPPSIPTPTVIQQEQPTTNISFGKSHGTDGDKMDVDIEGVLQDIMTGISEPLENIDEHSIRLLQDVLASIDERNGNGGAAGGACDEAPCVVSVGSSFDSDDSSDDDWDRSLSSYLSKISGRQSSDTTSTITSTNCPVPISMTSAAAILSPLTLSSTSENTNPPKAATAPSLQDPNDADESSTSSADERPFQWPVINLPHTPVRGATDAIGVHSASAASQRLRSSAGRHRRDVQQPTIQVQDALCVFKRQNVTIPKHLFRRIHSESSEDSWSVQLV